MPTQQSTLFPDVPLYPRYFMGSMAHALSGGVLHDLSFAQDSLRGTTNCFLRRPSQPAFDRRPRSRLRFNDYVKRSGGLRVSWARSSFELQASPQTGDYYRQYYLYNMSVSTMFKLSLSIYTNTYTLRYVFSAIMFAFDSITVSSAWELMSVSMCYPQGDGVNTPLSRFMYCIHGSVQVVLVRVPSWFPSCVWLSSVVRSYVLPGTKVIKIMCVHQLHKQG